MRLILLCIFYMSTTMNCDIRIPLHTIKPVGYTLEYLNNDNTGNKVLLGDYFTIQYGGILLIGSDLQEFQIIFSTVSSILWLPSVNCSGVRNPYVSCKSATYKRISDNFSINTISDHLSGIVSSDQVSVGSVTLDDAVFIEVLEKYDYPTYGDYDGIFGLGYSKSNNYIGPLFPKMVEKGLVSEPIFSFYFGKTVSFLILGGTDSALYEGNITYLNVSRPGFWQLNVDKIHFGDVTVCADGSQVAIDSSVAWISGPKMEIEKIYQKIGIKHNTAGDYEVDCSSISNLPNFDFVLDGHHFSLTGEDYVIMIEYGGKQYCRLGIYASSHQLSQYDPQWKLGTIFLRKYYSVYDLGKDQIGFAECLKTI